MDDIEDPSDRAEQPLESEVLTRYDDHPDRPSQAGFRLTSGRLDSGILWVTHSAIAAMGDPKVYVTNVLRRKLRRRETAA